MQPQIYNRYACPVQLAERLLGSIAGLRQSPTARQAGNRLPPHRQSHPTCRRSALPRDVRIV